MALMKFRNFIGITLCDIWSKLIEYGYDVIMMNVFAAIFTF